MAIYRKIKIMKKLGLILVFFVKNIFVHMPLYVTFVIGYIPLYFINNSTNITHWNKASIIFILCIYQLCAYHWDQVRRYGDKFEKFKTGGD